LIRSVTDIKFILNVWSFSARWPFPCSRLLKDLTFAANRWQRITPLTTDLANYRQILDCKLCGSRVPGADIKLLLSS